MSKWTKVRLGDCCEITSSKRCHLSDRVKVGVPFYRSKEIIQRFNGESIEECDCIEESTYLEIERRYGVPKSGDLLVTTRGSVGVPCLYTEKDRFYFADGNLTWFRNFKPSLNSGYLYYWFQSSVGRHAVTSIAVGTAQLAVPISGLKLTEILLPPIERQRKVSEILSDYDSAIDNARRQIALLEEAAMRLYREWFVVHTDQKWENGAVRKWFEITIGRTPPRKIAANFSESATDQKWCSIKDLQNSNIFISETAEMLTKQGVESSKIHISPAGTIFLSFKLTVGKVAITLEPMATNEAIAHFETTDRALRDYTYCYLHEFQYDTLGSTSSIGKAINSEIVRDMPFVMPDAKTLTRFSDMVSPIFDQIQNSVVFIRTLTEARDRLLPKLMSGEVSV